MYSKEETLRKFGRQLTAVRTKKRLSVPDLAIASGIETAKIIQIEAGKVNVLFTTIMALARGLKVNPDELLDTL